jgi:glycosyltransferase involved in cell wall biosynthesis
LENNSIKILQLIDSLHTGGAEMMAVNIFNSLNNRNIETHLVATRAEGPLKSLVKYPGRYWFLNRKRTLDINAFLRLRKYIEINRIQIIHAHSSSFFIAGIMKILLPGVKVIWHNHTGQYVRLKGFKKQIINLVSALFDAVLHVNKELLDWGNKHLKTKRQLYLANYPVLKTSGKQVYGNLTTHKKIVHVAGFRPVKDHLTLIEAFAKVKAKYHGVTLHLVGKDYEDEYSKKIKERINKLGLNGAVFIHGEQNNIGDWLIQADIGVLSSQSEGLPVALLEYGMAGLPVVATAVGEIPAVLGNGEYGFLVPPGDAEALAENLSVLLENPVVAKETGKKFRQHVMNNYSEDAFINQLVNLYREIL